jgi:PPOX class probable F420-dependent enzyme
MELEVATGYLKDRMRGVLVTMRRDGRPQLSNIAYHVEPSGTIAISVTKDRAKTANARRDPRVSLHVTASDFWSYVVVDGTAELMPVAADPADATVEALVTYYRAVSGEHPDWDDYRRAMIADGRLILRITPERAYGMLPR